MENWKNFLANSGIKKDKVRKKGKELIAQYEEIEATIPYAKAELADEQDADKRKVIEGDIKEMQEELVALNIKIVDIIQQDIVVANNRRENAKKLGFGNSKKETGSAPAPAVEKIVAKEGVKVEGAKVEEVKAEEVEDEEKKDEEKKEGLTTTEIVVGGAVSLIVIGLGLNYVFPDFLPKLFRKK